MQGLFVALVPVLDRHGQSVDSLLRAEGVCGGDRCSSTSQENRCPRSRETGTTLNVPEPGQDCDGLRTPATPNREATREEGSRGLRYPTELSVISQLRG